MTSAPLSVRIQDRTVTLPCVVREAESAAATFLVDAAEARRLLPGPELDMVEVLPGKALFSLGVIDYRDNDLGDYDEISLAFFVRRRNARRGLPLIGPAIDMFRGRLPTWIYKLPVNQAFTCEAGSRIWGFPKTVDEISIETDADRVQCQWAREGQRVMRVVLPRGGSRPMPEQSLDTYTWLEGALHRTRFVTAAASFGIRRSGVELELFDHPIADTLRRLGLPRRPLMSVWMGEMRARFEAPEKL